MQRYVWKRFGYSEIEAFKQSWPAHGLPVLGEVLAEFAPNGDLTDIDCRDPNNKELDSSDFDGPALLALIEDIQARGEIVG